MSASKTCRPIAAAIAPQVQKDVSLPNTEAAEERKLADIAKEQTAWRKRAREFLSAVSGSSAACASKREKRYRVKAFRWLLSTDSALQSCMGRGWAYFHQPLGTQVVGFRQASPVPADGRVRAPPKSKSHM